MDKLIHEKYLPFTAEQLRSHLPKERHEYLDYYLKSATKYEQFFSSRAAAVTDEDRLLLHKGERLGRQIEKDERFWIAACLMTFYHHCPEKWPENRSAQRDRVGRKNSVRNAFRDPDASQIHRGSH